MEIYFTWLIFALLIALYFVPAICAFNRDSKNSGAILVLNILFGWTLIGWVACFIWAFASDKNITNPVKTTNKELSKFCTDCGSRIQSTAKFCESCGIALRS